MCRSAAAVRWAEPWVPGSRRRYGNRCWGGGALDNRAFVHDAWYVSGYEPLLGARGERIGMLYVGFLEWPIIRTYLTNLLELGSGVVLLLLLSGLLVYRGARDLFTPIERMHKVVRQVQYGKSARVGQLALDPDHELAQLGRQFDAMLDRQDAHRQQMARSADELEQKVAERTLSLKQKTAELEHHIHMLTQARQQLLMARSWRPSASCAPVWPTESITRWR